MIKLPQNNSWSQPNSSYKMGSLWYTKNINLDEEGIIKLSPRMCNIFDDSANTTNTSDEDFAVPVAYGRYSEGSFYIGTTDEPFDLSLTNTSKTIAEDGSSNNPNMTVVSHACWWQNRWYASTDTAVNYNTSGTWTANAITGLTSGKRHYMTVFKNKKSLAVSDSNTVKLYDTSHSNTVTLTIPDDFEVTGLAYNNYRVGVITRLGSNSSGQNSDSYFFTWDGANTEAGTGISIGAGRALGIYPYKSSFVVLTSEGQLLYFNGGGFDELAHFPFYESRQRFTSFLTFNTYGDNIVVDGDLIYINIGFDFDDINKKGEEYLVNNPSGIWCYDPKVGLYHRYSLSNSRMYLHNITQANVNTTTNIFTTSNTVPVTGNPIILVSTGEVGGLTRRNVYYIIKVTSTTFKIAETYQDALDGNPIDITSASANNYFTVFDVIDYGISYFTSAGAVGLWGINRDTYTDILAGGTILNTANSSQATLSSANSYIPSRGYFVTPKLFLNSQSELIQSIVIKHRPLDDLDSIIVKIKTKDYLNVPSSTPDIGSNIATWTSATTFTTNADLSEVDALLDSNVELELELISGVGAGQMIKVTGISESSGTYTVTIEEDVVGYSSGLKSYFVIDNWKVCATIDSSNQTEGLAEIPVADNGKAPQFKIELRGIGTAIEDIQIINKPHKP